MSLINSAMRRVLAGDESLRALDPNGSRPRSSARVPRAVKARSPANAIMPMRDPSAEAASLKAKCELLTRSLDAALGIEGPTPYLRDPLPEGVRLPQVVRGFA